LLTKGNRRTTLFYGITFLFVAFFAVFFMGLSIWFKESIFSLPMFFLYLAVLIGYGLTLFYVFERQYQIEKEQTELEKKIEEREGIK
jgi:TRAP-type C4-dicarboxylate transport system permease small subunit